MSVNAENNTEAPTTRESERLDESINIVSRDPIEEQIKLQKTPERANIYADSTAEPTDPRWFGT